MIGCSVEGCERTLHARGMCKVHYMRWSRRGFAADPESAITPIASYSGAHAQVQRIRGSAKTHPCRHCNKQATNWALDHGMSDVALLRDEKTGCSFSINPDDYIPLCRSCHLKLDLGTKDRCRRGHDYALDGWQRPDGKWFCLACQRERRRAKRAKERAQADLQAVAHLVGAMN